VNLAVGWVERYSRNPGFRSDPVIDYPDIEFSYFSSVSPDKHSDSTVVGAREQPWTVTRGWKQGFKYLWPITSVNPLKYNALKCSCVLGMWVTTDLVRAEHSFYFGLITNWTPDKCQTSVRLIRSEIGTVAERNFCFLRWFSPKITDAPRSVKVKAVLISRRQYLWLCHGCLLPRRVQFVSETLTGYLSK